MVAVLRGNLLRVIIGSALGYEGYSVAEVYSWASDLSMNSGNPAGLESSQELYN
jgi:hypothetical protein